MYGKKTRCTCKHREAVGGLKEGAQELMPSLRDLFRLANLVPALKRWAKLVSPLRGSSRGWRPVPILAAFAALKRRFSTLFPV